MADNFVTLSSDSEPADDVSGAPASDTVHDVIIVGSGPAGYTAAIYSARAELAPLVFEGSQFGGALMTTTDVENFPGFAEGILGPDLMMQMREQAERFGADLRMEDVTSIDLQGEIKVVRVGDEEHRARAVILAMGAAARYLGIPGEQEYLGRGVSACATCDGFFFKDKPIVVVGGGDSAMEEATFLTKFGSSVTIVHRREEFRASRIMLERAKQNPKISFVLNATVDEVLAGESGSVEKLRLRDTVTDETREIEASALFVAIGHDPRSELVRDQVTVDAEGYVATVGETTATSLPGVFACGDLVDHRYRQAITAAGSGCSASIDAERWLAEQN
ncbi:thioredoxin-disulfide reductase [Dietzia sp. 179-F 9C3 NHS]|uniref:thioredoxin-disulfide reductase n=1 Tax=Dietzia sp. 179-F 9C3 NHS TaxID=3374295 RepID=UPI003879CB95